MLHSWTGRQILRCPLFLKWSTDSMQIISKIQAGRFVLVNRLILNCIWQGKGSKTSKSFQKEHSCIIYAKLPWSCNVVWVKVQTYELNRTVQNRLMVCQPISTKVQRKMNLYIWYIWFLYGLYMVTYKNQLKWITFTSLNVKTENC